ncbi:hypothetical protein Hdeb2414_s0003g00094711 [Helianthus debilis subsp. tardiflorus]
MGISLCVAAMVVLDDLHRHLFHRHGGARRPPPSPLLPPPVISTPSAATYSGQWVAGEESRGW